ncbi:cytochrome b/b6 domain-containing protein [Desulfomonile tiedjei]|uniref:Thiosulfate reductase cytochrome B subunit (Membrane anchoring protein) n=1 Tax=Desulfomonile tiedjei (strain ATCC 49306 / DSM 6799 / DCB-1) TaxID=706587 RepID=I4C8C6_DESTA|nr:cytochrome b/b6 domain-containing protein [Desulfomonile tiedjei]AFM25817.1 thiosulfate reductase cytochrome B subunit (membrane anchoring protein) [Desulfomonile tiedjei DSM 6799]
MKKWTVLAAVIVAATVLVFQYSIVPTIAQEQGTTGQPSTTTPSPATKTDEPAAQKKAEKPAEITNQECIDCHNPDILKMSKEELADQVVVDDKAAPPRSKRPFVTGELNLSINDKKYAEGVHADTTCVTCHSDITEVPHKQRLKAVDCKECHDEAVEQIEASAHKDKPGPKALGCVGCHDVHYGKGKDDYAKGFSPKVCEDCHKAYNMDTLKAHTKLYEAKLHLAMDCMLCHSGKDPGVHNIPLVKTKVASCESCHTKNTILEKEKPVSAGFIACVTQTGFMNGSSLKKYGYVLGAHRIPMLDAILILVVLGTFGLPIVHGGLRILTRRKEPIHLPEEKILLHPLIERLWHWFQALCIVMLIFTGIMLHWPEKFPGWFNWSVTVHNWFGWGAVIAFVVWFLYNIITGRISHYIPKKWEIPGGMITQAKFYGYGIFKHEPHPYAPTEDNKFNPLQKIAYLKFQLLLFPLLLISGILYMYPETFKGVIAAIGGMYILGIIHLILGALFTAFLVAHLYLATTGETIGENFKAIIFGYGVKSDHEDHSKHV